jgi:peptide/nickel transport system permease protein
MLIFLLKRFGAMLLMALCRTVIVFSPVNLKPNLVKLAKEQNSARMSAEPRDLPPENRAI